MRFEPARSTGEGSSASFARACADVVESSRVLAAAQLRQTRALAALARAASVEASSPREVPLVLRSLAAECAVALGVSDRVFEDRVHEADALVHSFPRTFEAAESGSLTLAHARAIVMAAEPLPVDLRETYEDRVLEVARPGISVVEVKRLARQVAETVQPEPIDARYERAAANRCTWVKDLEDGMAEFGAILPKALAYGMQDRLTRIARALQRDDTGEHGGTGEHRPSFRAIGNRRADVLAELVLTGLPQTGSTDASTAHSTDHPTGTARAGAGIIGQVTLIVPAWGVSAPAADAPGAAASLEGTGPIDSETARRLMAEAPGWDRVSVDSSGAITATDRYTIPSAVRRVLRARDERCRFPGCVTPGALCDIDHTLEWMNGGLTSLANLGMLCRRHHMLKHPSLAEAIRWRVRQDAHGELIWSGPAGGDYVTHPARPFDASSHSTARERPPHPPPKDDPPPDAWPH